ncbi:MAG: oxygen-dependent coproporphyrinogen oxidase [Balneolia bacterium]|nr:oxygen-dependent coproporphyrinogen oxidase [Balneolia bacterium]
MKERFTTYIYELQDQICAAVETTDGKARFQEDNWEREGGGGGRTRVITGGEVFEKGGVNCSVVHGELPELIRKRFGVNQGWFFAAGISLVLHPQSPMVPTVHANYRMFELYDEEGGERKDAWFGGGADLTPYYLFDEDAVHFHQEHKTACDAISPALYPVFKKECDAYFHNAHREEARGVGGIFYDYKRDEAGDGSGLEKWFSLAQSCGNAFSGSYIPIVEKRKELSYTDEQRYWQEIRRGRYVEFNLVHDRGTLFGLKTNGRVESILMSLPPRVRWDYAFEPEPGTEEARLTEILRRPKNWLD